MTTGEQCTFSDNLNDFFCRYEKSDHNLNISDLINGTTGHTPHHELTLNKPDVKKVLNNVNVKSLLILMVYVANY